MPNETQGRITDKPAPSPPAPLHIGVDGKAALPPPLHNVNGQQVNESTRQRAEADRKEPKTNDA